MINVTFKPRPGDPPYKIKKDLAEFEAKLERAVKEGLIVPGSKGLRKKENKTMLLGDFVRTEYYPVIENRLSPNTVRLYHQICDQFIIPSYGKLRLCDIGKNHLQSFVDFLAYRTERMDGSGRIGLDPCTVKRYATIFRAILAESCRKGFLETSPFVSGSIQYPKIRKRQLNIYSPDEVRKFWDHLMTEDLKTRVLLSIPLLLGLRRAEVIALKWDDIDFDQKSLSVCRSAYKAKGEKQSVKTPKSMNGFRTIFIPDDLISCLKEWKEEQARIRLKAGNSWDEQGFVFTDGTGNMISVYTLTRICSNFEQKIGLRHLKLHGLRHTCGSLLVSMGVDLETVRDIMGHDSISTTNIYLHSFNDCKRRASDKLNYLLKGEAT